MPVYQRKNSPNWYIRIGRDIDRSAGTASRAEAVALEAKWRQELWRVQKMGESPRRTWDEAVLRWSEDVGQHRRGWETDSYRLEWLTEHLSGVWLDDIDRQRLEAVMRLRPGISAATHNHFADLVRAVLRYASRELQWLDRVPTFRRLKVDNARVRFLKDWKQAEQLIAAMPPHWQDPARFSLLTGVRQGTMRALRQDWIDQERRLMTVPATNMKSGRRITLPLSDAAMDVVERQPEGEHVFQRPDGGALPRMNSKTWAIILRRSKLADFHWHDLRHTWASWAVMGGMDLYTLQRLGGWEHPAMVQRYAHLSPEHLRAAMESASGFLQGSDREPAVSERGSARKRK